MKLKKVLSIIVSSAMIVSVAPVESFATDWHVAVEEFSDETDEPVAVENEDETLNDESAEAEIQAEDEQQDIDADMEEEKIVDEFSDREELGVDVGDPSKGVIAIGEMNESVTWSLYDDGELMITGNGDMPDYESYMDTPWYLNYRYECVRKLVIGKDITTIGRYCFQNLSNLTEVCFEGENVEKINEGAFMQCKSLQELVIPESVKEIGKGAFWGDIALKNIKLSENIYSINVGVFGDCTSLCDITIPSSVGRIDSTAFYNCTSLTYIKIPDTVKEIAGAAFINCKNLSQVVLPNQLTAIQGQTFDGCLKLCQINIPYTVKKIESKAFNNCGSLKIIELSKEFTTLEDGAFNNCNDLKIIRYYGSESEWNRLKIAKENVNGAKIYFEYDPNHKHEYEDKAIVKNATCTTGGEKICVCKLCGAECIMVIPTEHNWNEGKVSKEATCEDAGEILYTCVDCGTTKIEKIDALGHKPITDQAISATCEKNGLTAGSHCSVCGKVLEAQNVVKAIGHTWDDGKTTKEATCEGCGIKTYTCVNCKANKTERIKALGHKIVKDEAVAATCETDGLTEGSHCSVCGKVLEEQKTIKATGHTEIADVGVDATCESEGKTEGSHCSVCGKILTEQQIIPEKGHKWDSGTVIKMATCTERGSRQFTCTECKKTKDEIIPATGHLWNKTYTIDKDATRTEPGKKSIHCSVCDEIKEESEVEIPATVQVIVKNQNITNTISWTLYSDGELLINGSGKMPDYDNYNKVAPWLKYDVKKVTISNRITQIGAYSFYECSSLKEIILPDSIKAIGEGTFAYCTGITEIVLPKITSITDDLFNGCSNLINVTIPNSVIDIGIDSFRNCVSLQEIVLPETIDGMDECAFAGCSNLKSITIPKKVTILQNGLFTECSSLTEVVIPEGVEEISDAAFDGCISLKEITIPQSITCIGERVFEGCSSLKTVKYTGKKSEWDKIEIYDSFLKKCVPECSQHDHDYMEKILVNPTCTEKGEKELICKICGEFYREEISATGHKNVVDNAIAATCEKKGKTEGSHCSVCGAVIVAQKDIPAIGHKYNSWSKISEATVLNAEKQRRYCSACGRKEERTVGNKLKPTISIAANKIPLKVKQKFTGFRVTGLAKGDSIVSWKSNKTKIVKISGRSNGKCTITAGKKTGEAVITVTLKSGLKKNITVMVQKEAVKTSKITGVGKNVTIFKGNTYILKPARDPFTSTEKITYKSSNDKVATVNSKGVIKGKKAGKTIITVKAGKKAVKCTVVVKTLKYGSVQGNVTYHYNRYRGYVADTGSRIFLVPMDGRAKSYINSNHIYFAGLMNEEVLRKNNIYCTKVDGVGNYKIDRIPEGRYLGIIISNNSTSGEWFEATNQDAYYQSIAANFTSYLNGQTAKSLGKSVAFYRYKLQTVNVYANSSVLFSEAFPYTYI